jgi:hypothetical protein
MTDNSGCADNPPMTDNSGCADNPPWIRPVRIDICPKCMELKERVAELEEALRDSEERRRNYRENTEDQIQELRIAEKRIAELEEHRAPNPGAVGTIRDKSILLKYKDMQIAQLQTARAVEKESRAMKESLEVQQ